MQARRVLMMRLKKRWWDLIASGDKLDELRLQTDYWRRRLVGREYDEIHLWLGYPPRTETNRLLVRRWQGFASRVVVHEEFGADPVEVYAIDVSEPIYEPSC